MTHTRRLCVIKVVRDGTPGVHSKPLMRPVESIANFTSCRPEARGKSAPIVRANAKTPIVSRSDDRTFQLSLLDGPLTVHSTVGTVPNKAVLVFCYSLDPLGISRRVVQVTISIARLSHGQVLAATESAADCLARLLAKCERPKDYYFLRHGRLSLTPR
jgi:hypothetical protein